jgi:uncharacterized protein (TIGR02145 family)
MKPTKIFLLLCLLLVVSTCKKEPENPSGSNQVEIGSSTIESISFFTAQVNTVLTSTGGNDIVQHGHCWSKEPQPDINDFHSSLGSLIAPKNFTSQLENLDPNVKYYIRPYITLQNRSIYGKQEEISTLKTGKPRLSTNEVSNVTTISAICGGVVMSDSGYIVTERGVCWDTIQDINIQGCLGKTSNGNGLGTFSSNLENLIEGKYYYVKAYATNQVGTNYGELRNFQAVPITLPVVITSAISNITTTSAQCGGEVTSSGNGTVSERGICWDTTGNPSLQNYIGHIISGSGTGVFSNTLSGLIDGTIYYIIAFATNEKGTSYGEIKSFPTLQLSIPIVLTNEVTGITSYTANCGGEVIGDGNGTVTSRGVCWDLNTDPIIGNCLGYTTDGEGIGSFNSSITGLYEGNTYYVRAYAINEEGIAYGTNVTFISWKCGDELNYEDEAYNTVLINNSCWMSENLNVGLQINYSQWQQDNGVIEKYCYWDQLSKCEIYGGLYLWDEMMNYSSTIGAQGICPNGWHIPSFDEYDLMITFLGGSSSAGGKLKETGLAHWKTPNTGATNESGFTALPGGVRTLGGSVSALTEKGFFWISQTGVEDWGYMIMLEYNYASVLHGSATDKSNGLSVRCLRDENK